MNFLPQDLEDIIISYKKDLERENIHCECCDDNKLNIDDFDEHFKEVCDNCWCEECLTDAEDCTCYVCNNCDKSKPSEYMFFCDGCELTYCSCMGINEDYVQINYCDENRNFCKDCFNKEINLIKKHGEYKILYEDEEIELEDCRFIHIDSVYHWINPFYHENRYRHYDGINPNIYDWIDIEDIEYIEETEDEDSEDDE